MICIKWEILSEKMNVEHKHKECVAVASTEEVDDVQLIYVAKDFYPGNSSQVESHMPQEITSTSYLHHIMCDI